MIKSMTAFASAKVFDPPFNINIQIRSYNSRYLDIYLKVEDSYRNIEGEVKHLISERIARGRIEITVKIDHESKTINNYTINKSKAKSYFEALSSLGQLFDLGQINMSMLLDAGDIIQPVEIWQDDNRQIWTVVSECLEKALKGLNNMKEEEGINITRDLIARLNYVEKILKQIETKSQYLPKLYKEKLEKRILELTDNVVKIDSDRILHEVAILASKNDITEEIVRSNSHIKQFKKIINETQPIGKKLNFLLQEFNREFNTMGSKVGECEISYMIVSIKSELEKIKEQVQNVE